ncbi:hypothetical protein K1T71_015067 [Dendrolimus kikuchii]|nr:hypothetical protein K1T71_015067 [Dendrolimus kikuchii]
MSEELPTWTQLAEFLEMRFRSLEMIEGSKTHNKNASQNSKQIVKTKAFNAVVQEDKKNNNACPCCNGSHHICHCKQFGSKSVQDRYDLVQSKRLCFNCLGFAHSVKNCKQNTNCRKCGRRHHSLLHVPLEEIKLADPTYMNPGKIDVLLGAEVYCDILLNGVMKHPQGHLLAQNTILGWIISGRVSQEVTTPNVISLHVQTRVDDLLKQFWEVENEPPSIKKKMTIDEKRYYQRILWRTNPNQEMHHYNLLTLTFGTACAPYLAVKSLQRLADDEQNNYPIAAEITKNDYYMDDLMTGCDSDSEAIQIYEEMNKLMKSGGFELQKWSSNNHKLLEYIGTDKHLPTNSVAIQQDKKEKVLGLCWNKETVNFEYSINLPEVKGKFTKRQVLSDIARLYDPMGWIAPVVIVAKLFIQKLWKSGLDWDDDLDEDLVFGTARPAPPHWARAVIGQPSSFFFIHVIVKPLILIKCFFYKFHLIYILFFQQTCEGALSNCIICIICCVCICIYTYVYIYIYMCVCVCVCVCLCVYVYMFYLFIVYIYIYKYIICCQIHRLIFNLIINYVIPSLLIIYLCYRSKIARVNSVSVLITRIFGSSVRFCPMRISVPGASILLEITYTSIWADGTVLRHMFMFCGHCVVKRQLYQISVATFKNRHIRGRSLVLYELPWLPNRQTNKYMLSGPPVPHEAVGRVPAGSTYPLGGVTTTYFKLVHSCDSFDFFQ